MDSDDDSRFDNREEPINESNKLTPVQNIVTARLKELMNNNALPKPHVDQNIEIELSDDEQENAPISPQRVAQKNTLDEWFRKRTPKTPVTNKKKKLAIIKEQLLEKMQVQRREQQEYRKRIFREDNEICDEIESEEEEELLDEESDEEVSKKEWNSDEEEPNKLDTLNSIDELLDSNDTSKMDPLDEKEIDSKRPRPTDFAQLIPRGNSVFSLHKTNSIPSIGSAFLINELADNSQQALDSQTIDKEIQNLMEEQEEESISERDNYERLLTLTKLDKKDTKKDTEIEEDLEVDAFKKNSKRKYQIESDEEEESEDLSHPSFPTTPSSGTTKLPKMDNMDLFQIDDGEDRIEMNSKPFLHTSRVVFADDEEEDIEIPEKIDKPPIDFELEEGEFHSKKKKHRWIDDEASLSGSEIGSDDEPDDMDQDEYEVMEGDNDELPDEAELQAGIVKTHLKLQNIDEERRLNVLKELYDSSINPANQWDRSFRSRFADDSEIDFTALVGDPLNNGNVEEDDDEEDEIITFKDHLIKKEAEAKKDENHHIFSLSLLVDDLASDNVIDTEVPTTSKSYTSNPNGIAKFIVDNFYFQDDSNTAE